MTDEVDGLADGQSDGLAEGLADGLAEGAPVVRRRVVRRVGMLSLNRPPSNLLTPDLRLTLWDRLAGLEANPIVDAIVILADGKLFSGGLDLAGLGADTGDAPTLAELCARIEHSAKPVVAAVQGPALSGGAELAMAAHYRLAAPAAAVGLPDIALGLVPGGGGIQRLTRLIGADPALRLLISGKSVTAQTARDLGLIDGIVEGDLASGAHAFAASLVERGMGPRRAMDNRARLTDGVAVSKAVATARRALPPGALLAARRVVDCVEAALLLPSGPAMDFEAEAYANCLADPESVAVRHVFLAERRISPGLLAPDGKGGRSLTEPGRAAVRALLAAQDRALGWLVAHGVTEAQVDATFLDWGFARAPFGTEGAGAPMPELRLRVVAAVVAAGARLVMAGNLARASDVDALAVHALGYPRRSGGPVRMAEAEGLPRLVRRMQAWAGDDAVWDAPDLMVQASRVAGGFEAVGPRRA